jgi:transposase
LSERPNVAATWAPVGQTPQLRFSFTWRKLSLLAGVTWRRFYFRLVAGSVCAPQAVEFLRALRAQLGRPLLVIWDGLAVHRSRVVRRWVEGTRGRVTLAQLPAYAPELNPVEYVWAHLKKHALANFCPHDLAELSTEARRALRRAQRRPCLVRAFWHQAELSL